MHYFWFRESLGDDVNELVYTVEVPTDAYNRHSPSRYVYCVFSDAVNEFMKTAYEFIPGNTTKDGKYISRLLLLNPQHVKKGSKL